MGIVGFNLRHYKMKIWNTKNAPQVAEGRLYSLHTWSQVEPPSAGTASAPENNDNY